MISPDELAYGLDVAGLDPASFSEAITAVLTDVMSDPAQLMNVFAQTLAAQQAAALDAMRRLSAPETPPPALRDKRFAHTAWTSNPMLYNLATGYLQGVQSVMTVIDGSRLPEVTRRKARLGLQLMGDAMAPSNIPVMNPAVTEEAIATSGASVMRGMMAYMDDAANNNGLPRQVDATKFVLGENLAATPGRIVFRNELIELIAYAPQTEQVHAIPLLCSPPWINKYYIMDLAPGRSFIENAVRHGHQTFAISYRNADASMSGLGLDDYLSSGLLAALEAVERITGTKQTNIVALCLGGTLTLMLLAYLAARGEGGRVAAATLTNTLADFTDPGELGIFTEESTIARLEAKMDKHGYLEAKEMSGTFSWMRANDLVWSYVVNNWFMGKEPPAFDILSWNADSTNMPSRMHSQYLRACYLRNELVRPGAFAICGTPIDLGAIRTPLYVLGAENDHIAPWTASYRTVNHAGSDDVRYTLTNAGHIAGIVNPPGGAKSKYWTKERTVRGEDAAAWRATAELHAGSWWEDWAAWAGQRSGPMVAPVRLPGGDPAPGSYVRNATAAAYDPSAEPPKSVKAKKKKKRRK